MKSLGSLDLLLDSLPGQPPSLIFLQEVSIPPERLVSLANLLNYKVFLSTPPPQSSRQMAVLHRTLIEPVILEVVPGHAYSVSLPNVSFLHLHAPSGRQAFAEREALFRNNITEAILATQLPPILVGDFNCICNVRDTTLFAQLKISPALKELVQVFSYTDAQEYLHPSAPPIFTFRRQGAAPSRLDRVYFPPHLLPTLQVICHAPTISDHDAVKVEVEWDMEVDAQPARTPSLYWKLNTAILQEEDFLPDFSFMWNRLVQEYEDDQCPALWWEEVGKPACIDFCITFSKLCAHRRREMAYLTLAGLKIAYEEDDWEAIRGLKERLAGYAAYSLAGRAARSGQTVLEGAEAANIQVAAELCQNRNIHQNFRLRRGEEVLEDEEEVEEETIAFFEALFQGRHKASADRPEPYDSGETFEPDFTHLSRFMRNIPTISEEEKLSMEEELNLSELKAAVEGAALRKAPGLDGLPYEFYKCTFNFIGPFLLKALNVMLEQGELTSSLRAGAVRLLPKVPGIPTTSQLRPITLLTCDYKLLSKIFVARLIPILPTVFCSSQLCSVPGRTIQDGITSMLSMVEASHQEKRPGFIFNLDFYHAYDRVCLPFVDKVLEAMGFGEAFRRMVRTLHNKITASFLLHRVSRPIPVTFSVRQGDPMAMLFHNIQLEPFLRGLHEVLVGFMVANIREKAVAFVDDVDIFGESERDILVADTLCGMFERISGAILNRNRKSAILGLGSWAGKKEWPLQWLSAPGTMKVFGVNFTSELKSTIAASWDGVIRSVQKTINFWGTRRLQTLRMRKTVLEVFVFSKLWYLAQCFPLPTLYSQRLKAMAGKFLWAGSFERLAWSELHGPPGAGGLGLSCLGSRSQALLAKQVLKTLGGQASAAQHWAYWIGDLLVPHLPHLEAGLHPNRRPKAWTELAFILNEVLRFGTADVTDLSATTSAHIYSTFMDTPQPPKITFILDYPWPKVWRRLWYNPALGLEADTTFRLINNILPLGARMARLSSSQNSLCPSCRLEPETAHHAFVSCGKVKHLWRAILQKILPILGPQQDLVLLHLAWTDLQPLDGDIASVIKLYIHLVYTSRGSKKVLERDSFFHSALQYTTRFNQA